MNIITQNTKNDKSFSSINKFFKTYKLSSILKTSNAYKNKGIPVVVLFQYMFSMIFSNRTMYMNIATGKHTENFSKDTVYRFLNNSSINWLRFTTMVSSKIANETITKLTSDDRVNVLIIDDTMFERTTSKKVELLSNVYDHAKKTYKNGFRLLTLGWSDGNTFLPINSCLLSSSNESNRRVEAKEFDKRTLGFQRRTQAQTKATTVMFTLIESAIKAKIPATHVLFDTWFCSPDSLIAVKNLGLDVVAMAKKSSKVHYLYNGVKQPLTEIYKQNRKRRGLSKYLLSVEVLVEKDKNTIPARIIYVRNKNKRKDYLALITTDMTISEEEVIRLYGKRWDIEVFFKVCKSYLKLSKECKSLSYDAMTAHVAIVFTRYMMLAVENRQTQDSRTLGELFFFVSDEMADISWIESFHILMETFINTISDKLFLTTKQLDTILDTFLSALPKDLSKSLGLCA